MSSTNDPTSKGEDGKETRVIQIREVGQPEVEEKVEVEERDDDEIPGEADSNTLNEGDGQNIAEVQIETGSSIQEQGKGDEQNEDRKCVCSEKTPTEDTGTSEGKAIQPIWWCVFISTRPKLAFG